MPINNGNRGCVALSITSMFLIDKILKEKGIKYKFYLTDSGYKENSIHIYPVLDKNIEFYTCNYPYGTDIKGSLKVLSYLTKPSSFKENISAFRNADFIFDIGQGDSFSDIYGKRRFDGINKIHKIARIQRKPVCMLPQTIGPFKNKRIEQQAIKSVDKSTIVMARDKLSYDFVKSNILQQKNVEEYIDVAFFMPYQKKVFSKEFIHVGLNISALLWHGGYTKNNQFGLKVDYPQLIRSIIEYFLSMPNVKLHLIPHVVGSDYNVENDYAISYELAEKYNERLILSPLFLTPILAKNYIAGMDFFIGARMHAAIAAFSSGVPVYPMAYSRKFNGLFCDTLDYPYLGDMLVQSEKDIFDNLKIVFERKDELNKIIQERMSGVVKERGVLLEKCLIDFLQVK